MDDNYEYETRIRVIFFLSNSKVVYLHPFLSFLPFSKFRKEKFM